MSDDDDDIFDLRMILACVEDERDAARKERDEARALLRRLYREDSLELESEVAAKLMQWDAERKE